MEALQAEIRSLKWQKRRAWAMYFNELRGNHDSSTAAYIHCNTILVHQEVLPLHIVKELGEMYRALKKDIACPVCLETIETEQLAISGCGHKYCKECLEKIKETGKCAICRKSM
jgi:hypothetical protein